MSGVVAARIKPPPPWLPPALTVLPSSMTLRAAPTSSILRTSPPPPHRPVRAKFPRRKFFSFAIISARSRQAVRRPQGGRRCSKGLKSFEDGGIHPPLLRLRRDAFAQDAGKAGHKARGSCPARKVAQLQACLRPQSWFWHSRGHREQARGRRERERGRGFDPSQLHFLPCPSDICCTATAVDELLQNYLIYIVRTLGGKPPL